MREMKFRGKRVDMREIKFRGKRVDNGEWVYGDLIHGQGSKHCRMYILPQTAIYPKGCHSLDGWEVKPETKGQFIGFKDKNKVDIYEGDFVFNSFHLLLACEWFKDGFWLIGMRYEDDCKVHLIHDSVTIIGNIHDNL